MAVNFAVIGITTPHEWDSPEEEALAIASFLKPRISEPGGPIPINPVDIFHIRKPDAPDCYARSLIQHIPEHLHKRLVLHSNYAIFRDFNLGGLHVKTQFSQADIEACIEGNLIISRSCHTIQEIKEDTSIPLSYSFLSPVFDSISKKGYTSKFSLHNEELRESLSLCPVMALGGVTPCDFQNLFDAKFAGAALLGYLWSPKQEMTSKIDKLIEARHNLH